MAKREIINIDTNATVYNTGQQYQTYTFDSTKVSLAPNSFNIRVPLQNVHSGVKRIYLKSLELPVGFPSIRATSNLNTFVIADSSNTTLYTATLSDKNYTTITSLLADINSAYATAYPTLNMTFSVNSSGYVQITSTNTTVFTSTIIIKANNLSKMLGFRTGLDVLTTRNTSAVVAYRLSCDDYCNLYLPQFSSITTNSNQTMCSFKVPLNTTSGIVYFRENQDTILNVNPSLHFSYLDLVIYDKFGYSLNSYGIDWSFSLMLEY